MIGHINSELGAVPRPSIKIVSDIDDTLFRALVDRSYPKNVVYPGARAFHNAFHPKRMLEDRIAFLSARFDALDFWTIRQLKSKGYRRVTTVFANNIELTADDMHKGKVEGFNIYRQFYPDFRYDRQYVGNGNSPSSAADAFVSSFVLVGDSGQGDIQFMKDVLADRKKSIALALIHDVVVDGKPQSSPETSG